MICLPLGIALISVLAAMTRGTETTECWRYQLRSALTSPRRSQPQVESAGSGLQALQLSVISPQIVSSGKGGKLEPGGNAKFVENVAKVAFDSLFAYRKLLRNIFITLS
jgi:hypothetical protein